MIRAAFLTALVLTSIATLPQSHTSSTHNLVVSTPVAFNNSEAKYYLLGNPQYPSGKAISYGINAKYSRMFFGKLFAIAGVGFFKQSFGIIRPFYLSSPYQPIFQTKNYNYHNTHIFVGAGYEKRLSPAIAVQGEVSYNWFQSFRQKYTSRQNNASQVNKRCIPLGETINLAIGAESGISSRISIGLSIFVPVIVKWNNDAMFYKYDYSDDTQKIAKTKFTGGLNPCLKYNL